MEIALVEPYCTGSHRQWAFGYRQHSRHHIELYTMPGRHWKWRMHGAAVTLARRLGQRQKAPDLILASDMVDLATLLALLPTKKRPPAALYFHENQVTYPWSPDDPDVSLKRNNQYGFINFTSALVADRIFFNSSFHLRAFLDALPGFLRQFPDFQELDCIPIIEKKSTVLPLGMNLKSLHPEEPVEKSGDAIILWNHRWEYDKGPDAFFNIMVKMARQELPFRLIVLGESFRRSPPVFAKAADSLASRIIHFGYVSDRNRYARYLWEADLLPVTSRQDFFGGSVVEAMYCNCFPLLPDRLAFPEHIPGAYHASHLYQNENDLFHKLVQAVNHVDQIRRQTHYQSFVKKYDWRNLTQLYDDCFGRMG